MVLETCNGMTRKNQINASGLLLFPALLAFCGFIYLPLRAYSQVEQVEFDWQPPPDVPRKELPQAYTEYLKTVMEPHMDLAIADLTIECINKNVRDLEGAEDARQSHAKALKKAQINPIKHKQLKESRTKVLSIIYQTGRKHYAKHLSYIPSKDVCHWNSDGMQKSHEAALEEMFPILGNAAVRAVNNIRYRSVYQ